MAILSAVFALTAACGEATEPTNPGASGPASTDYEANWRLSSGYGPQGEIVLIEGADISLIIDGDRGSGRAACNSYDVGIQIADASFRATGGGMTDMGCAPDVMSAQDDYMVALMAATEIERTGDTLALSGDDVALTFEMVPPPPTSDLVGTTWELESLLEGSGPAGMMVEAAPADLLLSEDGTFTGSTGCRGLSGEWREDGYEIHFTTMSANGDCSERLVDQDSLVVEVLGDGFKVEIDGDQMTVLNERGTTGLIYDSAT